MKAFLMISVSILFVATSAFAAKTASDCHRELKEQCKAQTGRAKFECMRTKAASMEGECKTMLEEKKGKFKAAMGKDHPCATDRDKCKDYGGGHGDVLKCLMEKRNELSETCKKHVEEKLAERPCFEDRMKFCKDAAKDAAFDCLKAKEAELSAGCKEKLGKSKKADFEKED